MILRKVNFYDHKSRAFVVGDLWIRDGRIAAVGNVPEGIEDEEIDLEGAAVLPGLLDVHTHGCMGADFVSCGEDVLPAMTDFYASHGVTAVMPTLASAPLDEMVASAERMVTFAPSDGQAALCGVHLEGRYLNPEKKGAHAKHLLAPLCGEELARFRMCHPLHVSAAYELDTDGSFCEAALAEGATLGLGHTAANYTQAKLAESRGVTSYTHLYNCMPPLHHRDGGAIAAAFEGEAFAEVICDGIHIAPEMVRLAYRNTGAQRFVLISDSMEATGKGDGNYSIAGNPVVVKDGKALTPEGALAGSTLTVDVAVNQLIDFTGIPLTEAILCATVNPARQIGAFDERGSIEVGKWADLIISRSKERLDIDRVMVRGIFRT